MISVQLMVQLNDFVPIYTKDTKGSMCTTLPVNTGVPQDSILGPLLFIIFINNMCNVIKYGDISMYADDTTLSVNGDNAVDTRKLKLDLEALVIWLRNNKLFLNTDKTKIRLVGTGAKLEYVQCDSFSVKINECELENVVKYKYLGVLVDNELNWHKNVDNEIQKVFCEIALLLRLNPYLDVYTL